MRFVPVGICLFLSLAARGQTIYTWVDASGQRHYTDDPNAAPKDRQVKTTTGNPLIEVHKAQTPAPPPPSPVSPAPAPVEKPTEPPEREWRALFRSAHARIEALEQQLLQDRRMVDSNGMPIVGRYDCYRGPYNLQTGRRGDSPCGYLMPAGEVERAKERIAANETALAKAKDDLDDLERRASWAAVPREWR